MVDLRSSSTLITGSVPLVLCTDFYLRLRDTVCSYRSTAHAHGRLSMDFELMRISAIECLFFEPKIASSI